MNTTINATRVDALVVGAGFSGLYMIYRLRSMGLNVLGIERGEDVGGTWYWNRYPGARCDVDSIAYSYSFDHALQQEWNWSERHATQPEILAYLQHVAERFDLRRSFRFASEVTAAHFVESGPHWRVNTTDGGVIETRYLIMATGCLSDGQLPKFEGLDYYQGMVLQTSNWPKQGVDLSGKRVAQIGTGSTGIQMAPYLAAQAAHLTVFQRTPNYSIPARNRPLLDVERNAIKANYAQFREQCRMSPIGMVWPGDPRSILEVSEEEQQSLLEDAWERGGLGFMRAFADIGISETANRIAADFVRAKIAEIVQDPAVAADLQPTDYPIGSKRICADSDYYATFNRPNVRLHNLRRAPIVRFTRTGIETTEGTTDFDVVIFAIGFDAMTGALTRIDLKGRNDVSIKDAWSAGPRNYLGLGVHGFPNMFLITGPGSPSVLSNMATSIEQHVDWVCDLIRYMRTCGFSTIEVRPEAEEAWIEEVNAAANQTLYPKANNWYLGANIPGKPRIFMPYAGGVDVYRKRCDEVAKEGYKGFALV